MPICAVTFRLGRKQTSRPGVPRRPSYFGREMSYLISNESLGVVRPFEIERHSIITLPRK